jgi:ATP-dependent Clp protease ATP-binding subunit ClpX
MDFKSLSAEDKPEEIRKGELLRQVEPEDLVAFGLIPEFIGRLPVLSALMPLDEDDLVHIMTEPRNALVRQYQKLFELEERTLTFTPDALHEIGRKAIDRGTGARALRSLFESVMLDLMYELPSHESVREVEITAEVVRGEADPLEEPKKDAKKAQKDSA